MSLTPPSSHSGGGLNGVTLSGDPTGAGQTIVSTSTTTADWSSGASGPFSVANVTLSTAQLLALNATPVQLVAAPGAGKVICGLGCFVFYIAGTHPLGATSFQLNWGATEGYTTTGPSFYSAVSGMVGDVHMGPGSTVSPAQDLAQYENQAVLIQAADNGLTNGGVATSAITAGNAGVGYAIGDTGFMDGGNSDCTYIVNTVGGGGNVLTYTITAPGTNYAVSTANTTETGGAQPGVGTGLELDILTITQGNGSARVVFYYSVITP